MNVNLIDYNLEKNLWIGVEIMGNKKSNMMRNGSCPDWIFEQMGRPLYWQNKAEELRRAARLIFLELEKDRKEQEVIKCRVRAGEHASKFWVDLCGPFALLMGYALENILKGLILTEHPEYLNGGKLSNVDFNHELIKLAAQAKIVIKKDTHEERLCKSCTQAMNNWGRYPIAKNASKNQPVNKVNESMYEVFEKLFLRISEEICNRIGCYDTFPIRYS